MTEYILSADRAKQISNRGGSASFTAVAMCPSCKACDVHPMRAPNPEPPRVIHEGTGDVDILRNGLGQIVRTIVDGDEHDRWDERPFDVVRACNQCGREWGQR